MVAFLPYVDLLVFANLQMEREVHAMEQQLNSLNILKDVVWEKKKKEAKANEMIYAVLDHAHTAMLTQNWQSQNLAYRIYAAENKHTSYCEDPALAEIKERILETAPTDSSQITAEWHNICRNGNWEAQHVLW